MLHGNCFQEDLASSFSKKNQKDFSWYLSVKTCYRTFNKLDLKKSKKMPFLQKNVFHLLKVSPIQKIVPRVFAPHQNSII